MRGSLRTVRYAFAFLAVTLTASFSVAQSLHSSESAPKFAPEWTKSEYAHTANLRDMAPMVHRGEKHEAAPIRMFRTGMTSAQSHAPDQALQTITQQAPSIGNVTSFAGVGNGDYGFAPNAAPPDTNLSVGATQVVQWVNESFAVFSKTGALLAGPTAGNTLFQALGSSHPCAVNNDGDIIAQYDKAANRWVLTQFSVTNGGSVGYFQCVAVSQTSDATGAYNVYAFGYGTTQFIDYPKMGVWNNAYYITYNIFNNGQTFAGPKLCAFDRTSMLAGAAATQVCFQLSTNFGGVLPADLDGSTAPPAGSPEYFVDFNTNSLDVFTISNPNFTSGTATLGGPTNIAVSAFTGACGGGGTCVPQLGTNQLLDSLADRLMYRLAYRNFGDHESLVLNHSIDNGGPSAIRWYEIRTPSSPSIFQQGTFAPDSNYRWMGSAAMDSAGNIAVGYSVSSSSLNPGIRFTGRAPTDPLGTMGTEVNIKSGGGSQNGNLNRWGDYSSLSVDPVDDCTLWYTTEYLKANGSFNWSTEIANFKFSTCGATPDFTLAASPTSVTVSQGGSGSSTITVNPSNGFTGTVTLSASGLPSGVTASFGTNPTTSTSLVTFTASSTAATGTATVTITGTSGSLTHTTTISLTVNATVTPDFSLSRSPTSLTVTQGNSGNSTITVNPSGGFTGSVTLSASGLPSGVTASFGTNPTTSTSVVTLSASSTATTGTATVTITGTSGSLTHTTTIALTVNAAPHPDFSLSASPASLTVKQGNSGSSTITVTPANGFSGSVTLSTSALPGGVTASFGTNPTTSTSVLTFTASSTATTGTSTITVTGTSGSLTHTTSISLIISSAAPQQLIGNPGFENGTNTAPWTLTPAVINGPNDPNEPPHSGAWDAWLDGYGTTHTDTATQTVTIPSNISTATLSFWLHIDTAETTTTTAFDTLQVQVLNTSNTVLATLGTFSNLNAATGYQQHSFSMINFKGQTVKIRFLGREDSSLQTSFVIDDVALNVQ